MTIALVQGHAIGAGFQLALSCDLRVVSDDAQFSMKESALGLVPDLTAEAARRAALGAWIARVAVPYLRSVGGETSIHDPAARAARRGCPAASKLRASAVNASTVYRTLEVLETPWVQYCVLLPRDADEEPWASFAPINTAALAAPFKPKDAELFSIISAFDAAYSAYNGYQAGMERFWTLQYLKQENITEVVASLVKEMAGGGWLVRADNLPLMLTVMGATGLMRGDKVKVQLGAIDAMALDITGTVIEKMTPENSDASATEEGLDESLDDLEEAASGPIAIAMNVNETPAEE